MCGIAGIAVRDPADVSPDVLDAAVDSMSARGPDDQGVAFVVDRQSGAAIVLGHRRLSILDVTSAGHQPMVSRDGRITIIYNGEVYNFMDIRRELEGLGHSFSTRCDTEVIIAAYQQWGEDFIHRCNGMWAIAILDVARSRILLYRDRIGVKPLYYGMQDGRFYFASVLSALVQVPGFRRDVDEDALLAYLWAGYVPGPYAMFKGIQKLLPGHKAVLDLQTWDLRTAPYWSVVDAASVAEDELPKRPAGAYAEELEAILKEAVRLRLVSDVPLGAFLSGGIDSSLVVSVMRKVHNAPVRTFSIGFEVEQFNEAPMARSIADALRTEHTQQIVTAGDVRAEIDNVPLFFDEPFSDSSCLPVMLLARMTRRHVTVALSGDGGDELFYGGYRHYDLARRWRFASWIPASMRRIAGKCLFAVPSYYPRRIAQAIQCADFGQFHQLLTSVWQGADFSKLVRGDFHSVLSRLPHSSAVGRLKPSRRSLEVLASTLDFLSVLPDDFLVKVDRATMASSLEARTPLLDYRLVEFSRRVPGSILFHGGEHKHLLKTVLGRYLPRALWDRPKQGFGVPLTVWFRHELHEKLRQELLDSGGLPLDVFDRRTIEEIIRAHKSGAKDRYRLLWGLMSLSMWYRRYARG
ncbi:MAG: asparagine synthase (glutamine-hydrolyzing) [Phycisphaerae bacterium]